MAAAWGNEVDEVCEVSRLTQHAGAGEQGGSFSIFRGQSWDVGEEADLREKEGDKKEAKGIWADAGLATGVFDEKAPEDGSHTSDDADHGTVNGDVEGLFLFIANARQVFQIGGNPEAGGKSEGEVGEWQKIDEGTISLNEEEPVNRDGGA